MGLFYNLLLASIIIIYLQKLALGRGKLDAALRSEMQGGAERRSLPPITPAALNGHAIQKKMGVIKAIE